MINMPDEWDDAEKHLQYKYENTDYKKYCLIAGTMIVCQSQNCNKCKIKVK